MTAAILLFALAALAAPIWPALTGRINDGANLLAPEARAGIEAKLAAHEARTTDQIVVATIPSLQGVTVEEFANGLFRAWALGDRQKNNGALLLVAPTERKVRIEVGYGLEGALTDALAKVIVTTAIAPKFKTGDFAGGIEAGVDAMLTILTGDAEEWQRRALVRDDTLNGTDLMVVLAVILVFAIILALVFRGAAGAGGRSHRTRNGRWIALPDSAAVGWEGAGTSGGGWSSGSSGGFSGGGGSSGGGGASGDW